MTTLLQNDLPLSLQVTEFRKSVNIWWSFKKEYGVFLFMGHIVLPQTSFSAILRVNNLTQFRTRLQATPRGSDVVGVIRDVPYHEKSCQAV